MSAAKFSFSFFKEKKIEFEKQRICFILAATIKELFFRRLFFKGSIRRLIKHQFSFSLNTFQRLSLINFSRL
jgi:hypothetical protein